MGASSVTGVGGGASHGRYKPELQCGGCCCGKKPEPVSPPPPVTCCSVLNVSCNPVTYRAGSGGASLRVC